jgi:intracellular multiplication protein IcmT
MALPLIPKEAHWRDSARQVRFFGIDARVSFLLLFFVLHLRLWTFILSLIGIIFFVLIERLGFSLKLFLRICRGILAGPRKLAIPWWKK